MMLRMKREFAGSQNQILPVFDTLLLLDRNVDLLTPLATQLSYEGLIDEIYGITNGQRNLLDLMFFMLQLLWLEFDSFCFFFLPNLQVTLSCPLKSLRRRSKVKPAKTYPQSPRSYNLTRQRNFMRKYVTKILTRSDLHSARRRKSSQLPLRSALPHLFVPFVMLWNEMQCNSLQSCYFQWAPLDHFSLIWLSSWWHFSWKVFFFFLNPCE